MADFDECVSRGQGTGNVRRGSGSDRGKVDGGGDLPDMGMAVEAVIGWGLRTCKGQRVGPERKLCSLYFPTRCDRSGTASADGRLKSSALCQGRSLAIPHDPPRSQPPSCRSFEMASYAADKTSTSSAEDTVPKLTRGAPSSDVYALDEKRRAALAEIDEAKFS